MTEEQDPLEGKSIEELKKMVVDLGKTNEENVKKVNSCIVIIQQTIIQLKETGLDLQLIGRNMQGILDQQLSNPRRTQQQQSST